MAYSTHWTDRDRTIQIEILRGPENFANWYRDLRFAAECVAVWGLISDEPDDYEPLLEKPVRPVKPKEPRRQYVVHPKAPLREVVSTRQDYSIYSIAVTEFKLDLKAWQAQMDRMCRARLLLSATLRPSIRSSVAKIVDLHDATRYIKTRYQVVDQNALQNVHSELKSIHFSNFPSVHDVIQKVEDLQEKITSLNGSYSNDEVMSKVISLLPDPFKDFIREWKLPTTRRSIPNLYTQLAAEQTRLLGQGKLKAKPAISNAGSTSAKAGMEIAANLNFHSKDMFDKKSRLDDPKDSNKNEAGMMNQLYQLRKNIDNMIAARVEIDSKNEIWRMDALDNLQDLQKDLNEIKATQAELDCKMKHGGQNCKNDGGYTNAAQVDPDYNKTNLENDDSKTYHEILLDNYQKCTDAIARLKYDLGYIKASMDANSKA